MSIVPEAQFSPFPSFFLYENDGMGNVDLTLEETHRLDKYSFYVRFFQHRLRQRISYCECLWAGVASSFWRIQMACSLATLLYEI